MAKEIQVASLTAPITVKIPFDMIDKFEKKLEDIADTLEYIAVQFKDIDKVATKTFKETSRGIKIVNQDNRKWVDGIEKVVIGQKKVAKETKKNTKNTKRLARAWGGVADKIAQVRVIVGLFEFAIGKVMQALLVPTGAFAGLAFLANKINSNTAEMVNLSKATGFAMNDMKALGLVAKEMGFTFEHINSLAEEWNNKIAGEKAGFAENNMREGLAAMGMSIKDVIDLEPDKAFEKIMNAGRDMVKNGKFDEFASAADKIYGQEANRMLTAFAQKMHDSDRDFSAFLNNYKDFVSVTSSAQNGAVTFTNMWNKGIAMVEKSFANFFGDLGSILGYSEGAFEDWLKTFGTGTKEIRKFMLKYAVKAFDDFIRILTESKNWIVDNQESIMLFAKLGYDALKSLLNIGINLVKALDPLGVVLGVVGIGLLKIVEAVTWLMGTQVGSWFVALAGSGWLVYKALAAIKTLVMFMGSAKVWIWIGTAITSMKAMAVAGWAAVAPWLTAAAPFIAVGAAIAGVITLVAHLTGEMETLHALFTKQGWKDILVGFSYDAEKEGALTPEEKERNRLMRINREKMQRLREAPQTQPGSSVSTDNSSTVKYVTNHNNISDQQTAQDFTDVVLRPATM